MSLEVAIILALIVLALAWLYRRQNRRAQEHLDLVTAWANLNNAVSSLTTRIKALEDQKRPAAKKPGTRRKGKNGQRAA